MTSHYCVKEIIIVEGRDDSAAIRRAVDAITIETHGYGIQEEIWNIIERAYREKGVIIFTDPDFSGEQIRRKLASRLPNAKHAYLERGDAEKNGNIGVENAGPAAIMAALRKARTNVECYSATFTNKDIQALGLSGIPGAAARRAEIGKYLGIGYGNVGAFLNKLNKYGVTREELDEAILVRGDNGLEG